MSAPARKLSELGKSWRDAPGWSKQDVPRIETAATLAPQRPSPPAPETVQQFDIGEEFRRQYEIWRSDHPQAAGDLPPIEDDAKFRLPRGAMLALIAGGAALATFYVAGVLPNLNSGGFQSAPPPPESATVKQKTARLEVPPMPVVSKPADSPAWPAQAALRADPAAPMRLQSQDIPAAPVKNDPPPKPVRTLAQDELDLLMKRGEEFIASGDLAAARLVLERAARAHDARAAFALASTYDPAVLETMQVFGTAGDLELAIMWYERAKQYGSRDAGPRLLALAQRN
jgi:hypothetical protein